MIEQQHPLYKSDRQLLDNLLEETSTDYNLAELARLKIRYHNFPGARDIQTDLEKLLQKWELTEEELYQKTRQIHAKANIYQDGSSKQDEDWS